MNKEKVESLNGECLTMGSESIGLQTASEHEYDDQKGAGREARRLEAELRRRESEVAHLERRIKSSKENLRCLPSLASASKLRRPPASISAEHLTIYLRRTMPTALF